VCLDEADGGMRSLSKHRRLRTDAGEAAEDIGDQPEKTTRK
jgi:hypothetical protein